MDSHHEQVTGSLHKLIQKLESLPARGEATFLLGLGRPDDEAQDEDIWSLRDTEVLEGAWNLEALESLLREFEERLSGRGRQLFILHRAQDEDIWSLRRVQPPEALPETPIPSPHSADQTRGDDSLPIDAADAMPPEDPSIPPQYAPSSTMEC